MYINYWEQLYVYLVYPTIACFHKNSIFVHIFGPLYGKTNWPLQSLWRMVLTRKLPISDFIGKFHISRISHCNKTEMTSERYVNVMACNSVDGFYAWWRPQMETFSALLAICAGNSPVSGEFPTQRSVTRSFDVSFDLRLNKRLSKQSWGWWLETLSRPLWRHRNV